MEKKESMELFAELGKVSQQVIVDAEPISKDDYLVSGEILNNLKEIVEKVKSEEEEFEEEIVFEKFWVIMAEVFFDVADPRTKRTRLRFFSKEEAEDEAEDVARRVRGTVHLLECVGLCEAGEKPIRWETSD